MSGATWAAAAVAAASALLGATAPPPAPGQTGGLAVRTDSKKSAAVARVPAPLVGSWTWGSVNPGRYVDRNTGKYLGHAGGGAVSYVFSADGTFRRYVLIDSGAGFSNDSIFSSMQGKAEFDEAAGTFTLRFSKGEITFEKKSGMTRRPLTKEDMERGGTVFTYVLERDGDGNATLHVNDRDKPAKDGRQFRKDAGGEDAKTPKP